MPSPTEKTINIYVLGVSVASVGQDQKQQGLSQKNWLLIPALSLNHLIIQDNSLNHSMPQFPHPWLHLTYLLSGEVVKFKEGITAFVNTLGKVPRSLMM